MIILVLILVVVNALVFQSYCMLGCAVKSEPFGFLEPVLQAGCSSCHPAFGNQQCQSTEECIIIYVMQCNVKTSVYIMHHHLSLVSLQKEMCWINSQNQQCFCMTAYLENPEMSGIWELSEKCQRIDQKSGKWHEKSCQGKLFIANFTFMDTPMFSSPLQQPCVACFKDFAA